MKKLVTLLLVLGLCGVLIPAFAETWVCTNCGKKSEGNCCSWCTSPKPPEKVVCSNCGAEFDADAGYAFCNNCAAPLPNKQTESVAVGDIVIFGTYPQTSNGTDHMPIEWIVLDVQDGKTLLLSQYGLEAKRYHDKGGTGITWETCTLRVWLNSDFLNAAFSAEEQSAILLTEVGNSSAQGFDWAAVADVKENSSGGNDTQDKIFLLSYAEANRYLGVQHWGIEGGAAQNIKSRMPLTEYAIKTSGLTFDGYTTADGTPAGWWWLRSPGIDQRSAAFVDNGGFLASNDINYGNAVVRPAFWLNLESDIF